jgi:SOS response regulatory protein OraA/RecX
LQRRGFGAEVIDAALEESDEPDDDLERARDILRTKSGSWARLDPETRTRRAQALLQRRGYDWSVIGPAVAELGRPASSGGPRFS